MGGTAVKGCRIDGKDIAYTFFQFRSKITDKQDGVLRSLRINDWDMRLLGSSAHPTRTSTHGDIDVSVLIEDQLKYKTFKDFVREAELCLKCNEIPYKTSIGFKQISIGFPIYRNKKETSDIAQIDLMFSETKKHYELMHMMKVTHEKFEKAALIKAIILTSLIKHSKVTPKIIEEVSEYLGEGDYKFFNVSDVGRGINLSVKDYSNKDKPKKVKLDKSYIIDEKDKFIRKIFHIEDDITEDERLRIGSICGITDYMNQYKDKFDIESIKDYTDEILLTRNVKFNWGRYGL